MKENGYPRSGVWKGVCRKLTKLYDMWKGFDLPVVKKPVFGPVTDVSPAAAAAVVNAIEVVLEDGTCRTRDMGGQVMTAELGQAIENALA